MSAPRALVTGGAGFLGSHLCDRLLADGYEVVVVDDFTTGSRANLEHLAGRVELHEASVLSLPELELGPVTHVFHLAALISGYDSLRAPDEYLRVNLGGLLRVIELAGRRPGLRVVFASSSTVYGNRPEALCRETDPCQPLTVYALSKASGEQLLALYTELYDYSYVCLRLFNVYGPRQNPDNAYANVTCKFSRAAARGLPVRLYGDGQQTRDFVYVDDVIEAFARVAGGAREAVYNVGAGTETSIRELLEQVQELAAQPLEVEQMPAWTNDIRAIRADVSRYRGEFAPPEPTALRTGLSQTIGFFRG